MATRENQMLQIFVALFGVAIVILAVLTYFFFKKWDEEYARANSAQTIASDARSALNATQTEANNYKEAMGFAEGDTKDTVDAEIQKDMERMAAQYALPAEELTYREIVQNLHNALIAAQKSEAEAKQREIEAQNTLATVQTTTAEQIAAFKADFEKLKADNEAQRLAYDQERQRINQEKAQTAQGALTQLAQAETDLKTSADELAKFEKNLNIMTQLNEGLTQKVRDSADESFEVPDGEVIWAVQRTGTVYINLGHADALRPQISFSVYGADDNNAARAEKKGSIEVTKVIDDHMSEARITDDTLSEPILPGDKIYTPVWHPGRKVHFALAGFIDIDDDGTSDRDRVKELIVSNGGVLDEELSVNTRYLIDGGVAELGQNVSEAEQEQTRSYSEMISQANKLGIRRISVSDFLDNVGFTTEARSVQLGTGATADDFPARAPGERRSQLRVPNARKFREREPPPAE
ncbi:MAG: hypothetical protein WDZ59_08100 [Pirellulales bacterium]